MLRPDTDTQAYLYAGVVDTDGVLSFSNNSTMKGSPPFVSCGSFRFSVASFPPSLRE